MFDELELGLVLEDAVAKGLSAEEREAAVAAVKEKICAHAETFAAKSYRNVDIYFGPGAPQAVVDAFAKARG